MYILFAIQDDEHSQNRDTNNEIVSADAVDEMRIDGVKCEIVSMLK